MKEGSSLQRTFTKILFYVPFEQFPIFNLFSSSLRIHPDFFVDINYILSCTFITIHYVTKFHLYSISIFILSKLIVLQASLITHSFLRYCYFINMILLRYSAHFYTFSMAHLLFVQYSLTRRYFFLYYLRFHIFVCAFC